MKKLVIGVVLGALGWQAYSQYQERSVELDGSSVEESYLQPESLLEIRSDKSAQQFICDGRTRCSEMTSCEEAEYFLANCPGVKMDGGGDGVPCERQWCGNR